LSVWYLYSVIITTLPPVPTGTNHWPFNLTEYVGKDVGIGLV